MAMISSSRLAELQHVPPAWKFCAVQSQERFDRENAQRADCGKRENHGAATKNIARQPGSRPRKKQAREEPSRGHPQGPRGSGSAPRLPSWGCAGTAGCRAASEEAVLLPGCADGGHVLRPTGGSSSPRRCPRRSRTRPSIRTWIRAAKQISKLAGNTEN